MDDNYKKWYQLFKGVFNNIVLFRLIYSFVRLYVKNELVEFDKIKELQEYKEREYITRLKYNGKEDLNIGDLPNSQQFKEVILKNSISIKGEEIPYGVEIIEFTPYWNYETPFITLPTSLNTIRNAVIYSDNNFKTYIPPNITSISFIQCPFISNDSCDPHMVIPNTIKTLQFDQCWGKGYHSVPFMLRKGDIPDSVTNLSIPGVNISNINKGALPNSIKHLEISSTGKSCIPEHKGINNEDNYLPAYLESLFLHCQHDIGDLQLNNCLTIKKITLKFSHLLKFGPNSLPSSVTDLSIIGIKDMDFKIFKFPNTVSILKLQFLYPEDIDNSVLIDKIPNSVLSLSINLLIDKVGIFPSSLTHFEFSKYNCGKCNYLIDDIVIMVSLLPSSLKSIILP